LNLSRRGSIHVLVFRQQPIGNEVALFCKIPVFKADKGTSENSLAAFGDSLIVENDYGYQGPYENISTEPGLARINIDREAESCELVYNVLDANLSPWRPQVPQSCLNFTSVKLGFSLPCDN